MAQAERRPPVLQQIRPVSTLNTSAADYTYETLKMNVLVPKNTECYWDVNLVLFQDEWVSVDVFLLFVFLGVCMCVSYHLGVNRL